MIHDKNQLWIKEHFITQPITYILLYESSINETLFTGSHWYYGVSSEEEKITS